MATRAALASRVYIAGQSIESSMAKIAAAMGVEVPPKPGGIYGKRPELREAANQDRLALFLGAVAAKVEKHTSVHVWEVTGTDATAAVGAAASNAVGPIVEVGAGKIDVSPMSGPATVAGRNAVGPTTVDMAGNVDADLSDARRDVDKFRSESRDIPKHAKPVHKPGRK